MKNLFLVLAFVAGCALSAFFSPPAKAGFNLIVDETTLRQVNGIWEMDVKIQTTGTPTKIYSLLLNLRLFPGDGQPLDTLDGISFVGLANATTDPLFASAEINLDVPVPHIMPGSLVSPVEVNAPATEKNAFTVRFVSYRGDPTNIRVGFMDVGNFYQRERSEGPSIHNFNTLLRSPNITITGVPEPSSCLLAGGLMALVACRRLRKRRTS